ncbi:unnamed protein product [Adineta ricciae]|uniref:Uncharacterized protein n=1 Tax=Adineta ricciae TaxID=249248 RepID=A0A814AH14_ADIRI|nr:unnamed protein product [Adineta ricciae]
MCRNDSHTSSSIKDGITSNNVVDGNRFSRIVKISLDKTYANDRANQMRLFVLNENLMRLVCDHNRISKFVFH